jgi:hypothetical protein
VKDMACKKSWMDENFHPTLEKKEKKRKIKG